MLTKLRCTFFVIVLLSIYNERAQSQEFIVTHDNWKWLNPLPHGGSFTCVEMVSSDTIFAGGYNGYGLIYYTYDGGKTWAMASVPQTITGHIVKIKMYRGGQKGFALYNFSELSISNRNRLLITSDGGKTWQEDEPFTTDSHLDFEIAQNRFQLHDSIKITTSGFKYQTNRIIISNNHVSFDLGRTAHRLENKLTNGQPIKAGEKAFPGNLYYFLDSSNGWAFGDSGPQHGIYYTNNKGASWTLRYSFSHGNSNLYPGMLSFKDELVGWYRDQEGVLYKTTDGGVSWSKSIQIPQRVYEIDFIDNERGFLKASTYLTSPTKTSIYTSTDGGNSWLLFDSLTTAFENMTYTLLGDTLIYQKLDTVKVSYDKGVSWTSIYRKNSRLQTWLEPGYEKRSLKFLTSKICFLAGPNNAAYFSQNGGRSFGRGGYSQSDLIPIPFTNNLIYASVYPIEYHQLLKLTVTKANLPSYAIADISHGAEKSVQTYDYSWKENRDTIFVTVDFFTPFDQYIYRRIRGETEWIKYRHGHYGYNGLEFDNFVMLNHPVAWLGALEVHNIFDSTLATSRSTIMGNRYDPKVIDKNYILFTENSVSSVSTTQTNPYYIDMSNPFKDWGSERINSIKSIADTLFLVGKSIHRRIDYPNYKYENLGSPGSELKAIDFLNYQYGVVAGNNCEIYGSKNSGNFWTKLFKPISLVSGLTGTYFTSKTDGYAISASTLYKTTDGGISWTVVADYGFGDNEKLFVFSDNSNAYVQSKAGALYKVEISSGTVTSLASGVKDFYFFDNLHGYYISDNEFFKTINGGNVWNSTYNFGNVVLNAVSFADLNTGYAGGNDGRLFKSTNGGNSWLDVSVAGVKINGISVVSTDTVFVGGDTGTFFYSYDGGDFWEPKATGTTDNLHHIRFFNGREGYFVTSKGYMKTSNAGNSFEFYSSPKGLVPRPSSVDVLGNLPTNFERKSSSIYLIDNSFTDFIYVDGINVLRNPEFTPALPGPTVASFTPQSGAPGTIVTVTGTNLTDVTSVKFNQTEAASFNVLSSTSLTAMVPVGASTGKIFVANSNNSAESNTDFTVEEEPSCDFPKPTISVVGTTLTSSSATGNQWLKNGVEIEGAVAKSYDTKGEEGAYTVRVTIEGCSFSSDPHIITGVEDNIFQDLKVYPNPATSMLKIELNAFSKNGIVEIYDIIGKKKDIMHLELNGNKLTGEINLAHYSKGIYLIVIRAEKGEKRLRIEKL